LKSDYDMETALVNGVFRDLLDFVDRHPEVIAARTARIVEGHGDLRPEHVCLAAEPVFIDCLEFNRDLRIVDPVDELGYLAMECECAGEKRIGSTIVETYRACTGDSFDDRLVELAAWHMEDRSTLAGRKAWLERARQYMVVAAHHCRALG
jgi:aminoglycoside phosphotransferase family enzyme